MKLFGACISTHNISNMVEFYSAIFDCEPHIDGPDHQFNDAQLILFQLDDTNTPSTKNAAMVYSVNDVDAEYLRLNKKGIASTPPTDRPWGVRSFILSDPDGNTISFYASL